MEQVISSMRCNREKCCELNSPTIHNINRTTRFSRSKSSHHILRCQVTQARVKLPCNSTHTMQKWTDELVASGKLVSEPWRAVPPVPYQPLCLGTSNLQIIIRQISRISYACQGMETNWGPTVWTEFRKMSTTIVGKSPSIVSVSENGWYYIMVLRFEQQQLPTNEQHIHKQKFK